MHWNEPSFKFGKYHIFFVTGGTVLGHKISTKGIKVDPFKIEVIEKLFPLMNVKGVKLFLGHADFYRRFIREFSKN